MVQTHARASWDREYSIAHSFQECFEFDIAVQNKALIKTSCQRSGGDWPYGMDLENSRNITVQHELLLLQFYYI